MIDVQNVSFGYGREQLLQQISCRLNNSEVIGLIGPNGAGKSTLLRLCAGILRPQNGKILVDDRDVSACKQRDFARRLALLPQNRPTPALSVHSLVMLGRFAHGKNDRQAAEEAIHAVGLEELANRDVRTLSGGQRQMAYLAMLLAQQSPNVLLDEPLTHLDIGSQLDVAGVIRHMKEQGRCVAVVVHDLNMLETLCDRAILLDQSKITFDGSAHDCLRSEALQNAFGVRILENQGISFAKR